jgi:hypothetical protein
MVDGKNLQSGCHKKKATEAASFLKRKPSWLYKMFSARSFTPETILHQAPGGFCRRD